MSRHVAIGPDGGNLLGFLASVGALVALSEAWPERDVRLSWTFEAVGWRPVIDVHGQATDEEIVGAIHNELAGRDGDPEFARLAELPCTPEAFEPYARAAAAAAKATDRRWADCAAAYASDVVVRNSRVTTTALQAVGVGRGRQRFIDIARELIRGTSSSQLHRTLFDAWTYEDGRPSMRWDPIDDRRWAYRAEDPSDNSTIRTQRGANRLGLEALRCFPALPVGRKLVTTGFRDTSARTMVFRWPVWTPRCSFETVRSLLCHHELVAPRPEPWKLEQAGIAGVFETRRIMKPDGYVNFAPAVLIQ